MTINLFSQERHGSWSALIAWFWRQQRWFVRKGFREVPVKRQSFATFFRNLFRSKTSRWIFLVLRCGCCRLIFQRDDISEMTINLFSQERHRSWSALIAWFWRQQRLFVRKGFREVPVKRQSFATFATSFYPKN